MVDPASFGSGRRIADFAKHMGLIFANWLPAPDMLWTTPDGSAFAGSRM